MLNKKLNIIYDKRLELILAIHVAYKKYYPEKSEDLDWIECPNLLYVQELIGLIKIEKYPKLCEYIELFLKSCDLTPSIAVCLTDDYEINEENVEKIKADNQSVKEFVNLIKSLALEIKWDDFFENHNNFYKSLVEKFSDFLIDVDVADMENFYQVQSKSYNFIPSILMNGGFGPTDAQGNLYYIRGFIYNDEKKDFEYNNAYLLECLFHEFSHSIINSLVDKYFDLFIEIDLLYEEALRNNLPKCYQNKRILLYEYFVRVNAHIMVLKYYPQSKISDFIKKSGFIYIEELIEYTNNNIKNYGCYENFFKSELIDYMNSLVKLEDEKKLQI